MQHTNYQQIAKEFMDLWQKQVSAVVTDKQFIHAMLELFQSMQTPNHAQRPHTNTTNPAHASDAGHELLAELAFRLTMCEKRLATLEQQGTKQAPKKEGRRKKAAGRTGTGRNTGSAKTRK